MIVLYVVFWLCAALTFYAHIGYPLLMKFLASIGRRPALTDGPLPTVTLIIPAYNEDKIIRRKIENTRAIDYPTDKLQIIVASDGSSDDTVSIAKELANDQVEILDFAERRGKATVLNAAMEHATGDLICLCDANVMFEESAIREMARRMNDDSVGTVGGDVQIQSSESNFEQGESLYYRLERSLQISESQVGSSMGIEGGMYMIRKEHFRPLRSDTILDDFVILIQVIRQGKRAVYEPKATAVENATPRARDEFRRRIRVTAGAMQVLKRGQWPPLWRPVEFIQFVSHKVLRWLGPIWLFGMLLSSFLLWSQSPFMRFAATAQLVAYSVALVASFVIPVRKVTPIGVVFYFSMSHVAMGIGMILGLFNLQSALWRRTQRAT